MGQVACGKKSLPDDNPFPGTGVAADPADDKFFRMMLTSGAVEAPPQKSSASSRPSDRLVDNRAEIAKSSSGSGSGRPAAEAKVYSSAVLNHAARLGVPLPIDDEEEPYGVLDEYVDDLLGTPLQERPAEWQQPSQDQTEAELPKSVPNIIYADGRKGPVSQDEPQRSTAVSKSENPQEPNKANLLEGVIKEWATVDASVIKTTVVTKTAPSPKRKANVNPRDL